MCFESGFEFSCDTVEQALGNLLAVIHRDGGHYQAEHGMEKATRDAADIVVHQRSENNELQRAVDELRACHNSLLLMEGRLRKELREARAEIERLRSGRIIDEPPVTMAYKCDHPQSATRLLEE